VKRLVSSQTAHANPTVKVERNLHGVNLWPAILSLCGLSEAKGGKEAIMGATPALIHGCGSDVFLGSLPTEITFGTSGTFLSAMTSSP